MAYTKKTWAAKDVITSAALNNIETGIEASDKALASKAKKGAKAASPDAAPAAGETFVKAEFDAVVTLVNELKGIVNTMNA